jgi:bidirectional [NiFe] hydrogenase diaphorase subunit
MPVSQAHSQPTHPSGDERYSAIDLSMRRIKYDKEALLEVLNTAQETFGYLSEDLLIYISQQLSVSLSKVYGVATFYHMYTFTPLGEHNCIVCTGTACHVKGADGIVQALSDEFAIDASATTDDGKFSLTTARCLGSCGLAPVIILDGLVRAKASPETVIHLVKAALTTRETIS